MINDLIRNTEETYGEELAKVLPTLEQKIQQLRNNAVAQHPTIPRGTDGFDNGSISIQDARLLYILVRNLKPKTIFEIGTWIGTSAMVMAEAMRMNNNGGHIYTCDANTYYALDATYDDIITPIHAYSDKALQELPKEAIIDFVFADGELTFPTIKVLKQKLANNATIATHDFTLPAEKGVLNLVRMQLASFCKYTYVLPNENTHTSYNSGALGLLTLSTQQKPVHVLVRWFLTLHLAFVLLIVKIFKKIFK